jgi:hypothetical protein
VSRNNVNQPAIHPEDSGEQLAIDVPDPGRPGQPLAFMPGPCGNRGPLVRKNENDLGAGYTEPKCNRPAGHTGNHTRDTARSFHEWTPSGEQVRRQAS